MTHRGQRHDITRADALSLGYNGEYVIADKSYDAEPFGRVIKASGAELVISPRARRKERYDYDKHLYRERHLVECTIDKIKRYRRIFSRFEELAKRCIGFPGFVSVLIWLRSKCQQRQISTARATAPSRELHRAASALTPR